MAEPHFLQETVDFMRANGVRRLVVRSDAMDWEVELDPPRDAEVRMASVAPPKPPKTADELAKEALEKRREAYRREFGHAPTDAELRALP